MSEVPEACLKRARTISVIECRACLTKIYDDSCCVDLFRAWDPSWPGMGVSIAEDLAKLSNIQISVSDTYSKNICKKCCTSLKDAINFTCSVQNNDLVLRKRHKDCTDKNPLWPKPIQVDKNITGNAFNEMSVEVKQEVLTEDEYENNETCSESEPKLDIKIEPEEITPPTPSIVIEVNGPYSLSQPTEKKTMTNGSPEFLDERLLDDVKKEPISEDEAEPSADMPKDCMLCFKTFKTVKGLKAHVIAVHSYDSVSSPRVDRSNVCTTCNRSFATRTDLFVHETCHSKFACYVCDKKFDTFLLLTKHRSKQCMKTSIMPRLKTLDDVRRPEPVYYICDNKALLSKKTLKTAKSTAELFINSSSQMTEKIVPNPSLVKTNPVEQPEPRNCKTIEQTSSVNDKSSSGVEDIISEWNEIPEESTEKVPQETSSSPKIRSDVNKLSGNNDQKQKKTKIIEAIKFQVRKYRSEKIETQENTIKQESIDTDTAISEDQSESCEKVKDIEEQKPAVPHISDATLGSQSSNDTATSDDKTKENESGVSHDIDEERYDANNKMDTSEVSYETKENVQRAPTTLETAFVNQYFLKSKANKIEVNIELQSLDNCANDKTRNHLEQIDATEIKQNETLENFVPLLSKLPLGNLKSSPGDSMEIQLEIHSMDKEDDAMDIDHDLENKIKTYSRK